MTYNIHHGKGVDKQLCLDRILHVIKNSEADIIGLNEVDRHFSKRSNYEDQITSLAKQLNMYHSFSPSISFISKELSPERHYGNALLSRYPILTEKNHPFHYKSRLIEGRSVLEATVKLNRTIVRIFVSHLSLNLFLQRKQTEFIMNQKQISPFPMIIMGDWNMKPRSWGWRKMTSAFQDVWEYAGIGEGYTYPSLRPRSRLDYLFVSKDFQILDAEVVKSIPEASDHLPLKATIQIKE
ncbi:endonuclease/exonuclease/phosphatase family protein [Bacillus sp. IB182487]|uniref:Endonuclease/exonuclease/phosphatase family protein n=2 Tax=Metabacillus arenae TaxID=2771434 RepID=A0A926RX61_9BACI|nr:endonuclease/exonuclease/phosphatase family protein [Metabacillus arenae]